MQRIMLRRCDLKRSTFRCGGPGGQHQNKTESGVRYVHLPTGIVAESRTDRSQHANDRNALRMLQAKLDEMVADANRRAARLGYEAKAEAGFGGQQLRSYVLDRDGRVVDHRSGHVDVRTRDVMRGRIDGLIRAAMLARLG
jgi:peptide chain release factor 2